jgi:hypothetical protein
MIRPVHFDYLFVLINTDEEEQEEESKICINSPLIVPANLNMSQIRTC